MCHDYSKMNKEAFSVPLHEIIIFRMEESLVGIRDDTSLLAGQNYFLPRDCAMGVARCLSWKLILSQRPENAFEYYYSTYAKRCLTF